jgi:hypothetical protein
MNITKRRTPLPSKFKIAISPADASLNFIYNDKLASLLNLGEAQVTRASHVEPATGGGWTADMAPVGGPVLTAENGQPFKLRQEALDAEVHWLEKHLFQGAAQ